MAPVYSARHVSGGDKTVPLFSLKGLNNYAPQPISQCGILGVALEKQVAFTQYAANVDAFLYASLTKTKVVVSGDAYGYFTSNRSLDLNPPPVSFTLQKEIPFEAAEKLVRMLGTGASKNVVGKITVFQAPSLDLANLNKILPLATSHFNAGRESVNPMGLKAYWFLTQTITEFLRVHSYSAFTSESKDAIMSMNSLINGFDAKYYAFKDKDSRRPHSRFLSGMDEDDDEEAMEGVTSEAREAIATLKKMQEATVGYLSSTGNDTVLTARHPRLVGNNVGSSAQVPELPGILFPYFHGLVQPDHSSLMRFVHRHLFRLLGSTMQECQDNYAQLRRGFNSLATTDVGMALSHIVLGIELALETQGRVFVIIDSKKYQGFALLGARFAVFDSTKWVMPVESHELRDELAVLDPHTASVGKLISKFAELRTSGVYSGPVVTEASFEEPENLIPVFAGLQLNELGETERELNQCLRSLNYMGSGYLTRNPQLVCELLEMLFSENEIKLERPTYIPTVRTDLTSKTFRVLSRTGPESISLWNEKGQDFECKAVDKSVLVGGKRKVSEIDVYGNLPSRILITPKPLEIAVRDMDRVMERGAIRMDLKERAGKNRNMSVESEIMRKKIWKVLVDNLHEANAKKRKVDTEKKKEGTTELGFDDALHALLG